jgi:hypothetical protein
LQLDVHPHHAATWQVDMGTFERQRCSGRSIDAFACAHRRQRDPLHPSSIACTPDGIDGSSGMTSRPAHSAK